MSALNRVRELARAEPPSENSGVFRELLDSLERGEPFRVAKLYDLGYSEFELALVAMKDWRLHRYQFIAAAGRNTR